MHTESFEAAVIQNGNENKKGGMEFHLGLPLRIGRKAIKTWEECSALRGR